MQQHCSKNWKASAYDDQAAERLSEELTAFERHYQEKATELSTAAQ